MTCAIFLGLGHAQLFAAGVRHHFAEDVFERLRRKDRLHELVELVAEYCVMPTAAAKRTTRWRAKPEKSGSSMAPRISRTRSARKLKHSTPSPSFMPR